MRGWRSGVFCHVCGFPVTMLMPFGFEHRKQRPAAVLLVVSDQTFASAGPILPPQPPSPPGGGWVLWPVSGWASLVLRNLAQAAYSPREGSSC